MIRIVTGSLLESSAYALVNPVNCVGVMGKGLALAFKRQYPAMFKAYAAECERGEIQIGKVRGYREHGKLIINFPTKRHWRERSRIEDIEAGLLALHWYIMAERIPSIAIPALGCGLGGLRWADVEPMICAALGDLDKVDIELYPPR
jgi:O-acetyl-ADP-ribose deacetylase (regulator of RNase III)